MNNKNNKDILHAYYKSIGEAHVNNILKDLDEKKSDISDLELPNSLKQKLGDFFKVKRREDRRKNYIRQFKKISSRVAIFILALFLTTTIVSLSVEAFRVKILNWFVDVKEQYTEIKIDETKDNVLIGYYYPTYIPDGYDVILNQYMDPIRIIHFSNKENIIEFVQAENGAKIQLDTEDTVVSDVLIGVNKGLLITKEEKSIIFWNNDEKSFSIKGYIDKNILLKMAESIEKK